MVAAGWNRGGKGVGISHEKMATFAEKICDIPAYRDMDLTFLKTRHDIVPQPKYLSIYW